MSKDGVRGNVNFIDRVTARTDSAHITQIEVFAAYRCCYGGCMSREWVYLLRIVVI